jgi:hypothetical protein
VTKRSLEPRMLTLAQAAEYCGMGVKAFKVTCPIVATALRDGLNRFDRYKLDDWLDSLAERSAGISQVDWLGKLFKSGGGEAQDGRHRRAGKGPEAVS